MNIDVQLLVSVIGAATGIIGTMLLILRHFQESARRREAIIYTRIDGLRAMFDGLKDEVRREYVRDHQLKELRDEMRAGFTSSGEKIAAMSAALERLIGRLESSRTTA